MSNDEIEGYVNALDKEVASIRNTALKLTWSMRGGVQYTDLLNMSLSERQMISELANEHIEITQKSRLPFF